MAPEALRRGVTQEPPKKVIDETAVLRRLVDEGAHLVKHADGSMLLLTVHAQKRIGDIVFRGQQTGLEVAGVGEIKEIGGVPVLDEIELPPLETALKICPPQRMMLRLWELHSVKPEKFQELLKNLTTGIAAYSEKLEHLKGKIDVNVGKEIEEEMKSKKFSEVFSSGKIGAALEKDLEMSDRLDELSRRLFMNLWGAIKANQIRANRLLRNFESRGEEDDAGIVRESISRAMAARGAELSEDAQYRKEFYNDNKECVKDAAYLILNEKLMEGMNPNLVNWFVLESVLNPGMAGMSGLARIEWTSIEMSHAVATTIGKRTFGSENYFNIHYHPSGDIYDPFITLMGSATDIGIWTDKGMSNVKQWTAICGSKGVLFYRVSKEMYDELMKTGDELDIYSQPDWKRRYLGEFIVGKEAIRKELKL